MPFFSVVDYFVPNDRLTEIVIRRDWQVGESARELEMLKGSLFDMTEKLWGLPTHMGTWSRPFGTGTSFTFVVAVWQRGEQTVLLRYTPREVVEQAIVTRNRAVPLQTRLVMSSSSFAEATLEELELSSSEQLIKECFGEK
jgi:hypothetical protein